MSRPAVAVAVSLAALAASTPLEAQEEAPPTILAVSQWICPNAAVGEIEEGYERYTLPIERELVAEGKLLSAGMFFHAWADEWNVGYYRVAPGMSGLMEAVAEANSRLEERHPELAGGSGPFAACSAHKDNIYFMGPSTGEPASGG